MNSPSTVPDTQKFCEKHYFPFCFLLYNSFLHIAVVLPRKLGKLAVPKRVKKPLLSLCAQKYCPTWMASPQDHMVTMEY